MRLILSTLFLALVLFAARADAQVTGTVVDAATGLPVANVSIYYDGSSIGTVSNEEGKFKLPVVANNVTPLIFSCVGFAQLSKTDYPADKQFEVKITRKPIILRTVNIGFDGLSDDDKIKMFKREFLGPPSDIHDCTILNIEDVLLSYEKQTRLLTGLSDQPVIIRNPYLGYTIKYDLAIFASTPQRTVYQGFQFFVDDPSLPGYERKKILDRRDKAYYGSPMHFIRSLWEGTLAKEGFIVYRNSLRKLTEGEIICEEDGKKYFNLGGMISILYKAQANSSTLTPKVPGKPVEIDSHGYFDPSGVVWNGDMGKKRMAALLPLDFEPSDKH